MKYLFFLVFSLTFAAAECRQSQNKIDSTEVNKRNSMETQTKRIGDLEYKITVEEVSDTFLQLNYEVKNLGESDYILYNRGTSLKMRRGTIYVEPQANDRVELSQKEFFEPKDKDCPDREALIYPAASWLKAKQTVKEEVSVSLPLKLNTPFDDCRPQPEMPKQVNEIRFCLGAAKVNSSKNIKANEEGIIIVRGGEDIAEQQLLCSDAVKINKTSLK